MTRDKYRATCIEAMARAIQSTRDKWAQCHRWSWLDRPCPLELQAAAALDSLRGIACVVPIEATPEMLNELHDLSQFDELDWRIMTAAGDLTNPPEKKP